MFAAFGDNRLDRVDSTTPALRLAEWKASEKTRKAYSELFSNHDLLSKIGYGVFKQYREKELPTMHCAYVLSICDILLNRAPHGYGSIQVTRQVDPKYSGQVIKFMIQYQVRLQV